MNNAHATLVIIQRFQKVATLELNVPKADKVFGNPEVLGGSERGIAPRGANREARGY